MIRKDRAVSDGWSNKENHSRIIRVSLMATETIAQPVHGGEKVLTMVNGILRDF